MSTYGHQSRGLALVGKMGALLRTRSCAISRLLFSWSGPHWLVFEYLSMHDDIEKLVEFSLSEMQ